MRNKRIIGYTVSYRGKVLENIILDDYNRLSKSDSGIKKYRKDLYEFFKNALLEEGEELKTIKHNLYVDLIIHDKQESKIEKAIRLFETLPDNRLCVIAKGVKLSTTRVSKIITEYLISQDGRANK